MMQSKKFLAILLTLCMLMSFVPFGAFASTASAEVVGQQLMLGDDLTMHFHVRVNNAANPVATLAVGDTVRNTYDLAQMTAGENGYDLPVSLGAPEMAEIITLTVKDGDAQILQSTYSVVEYARYLLEGNYTDETKALVKEMLNYGAKSQIYFDYNTDNLANSGYETETQAVIPTEVPALEVSDNLSGMAFYGASMVFESKIAIRFYFNAKNGTEGYTFAVEGKEITDGEKNGLYYIEVADINPDQMDTLLNVSVTKDDQAIRFSYSPMAYIIRMYHKESTSSAMKDMLLAANGYFQAAKVFTGVAENEIGSLSLQYRYGTGNLIQINTNLPANTPCVNFTANDNGCDIDQSGNQYQQFGWAGMDNVDGTIVITLHFNGNFEAGQTYVLPKGAVFGFTNGSKYTLDKNYTFTFDGSSWTAEAKEPAITLSYRYGTNNLIQFNTNLPSDTPCVNFTAFDNGCSLVENTNKYQNVGWIGMDNVDGTIVLTFHFNSAFSAGQNYVLGEGSVFGFTDGSIYVLESESNLYWNGSDWSKDAPTVHFTYRYGTANLIQVDTDLPSDTPCVSFTASDNGCDIDQSGNQYQQFGWAGMDNVDGTIVITFHFNSNFEAGQDYVLPAGAAFGFTDGKLYYLDGDYTFRYDGASWSAEIPGEEPEVTEPEATEPEATEPEVTEPALDPISFQYRYGTSKLIQVNTNLPAATPCVNFLATDNGCSLLQSGDQQIGWVGMVNADGVIVLTFNFNGAFAVGQSFTLSAGSVFGFTDGSSYALDGDYTFVFDGSNWSLNAPEPEENLITLTYRYGTDKLIQFNTDLPATVPCVNFLATDNGSNLLQGGNQQFGWAGMESVDGITVITLHFNNAFTFGQSYTLEAGSVFGFTDGSSYKLDKTYTLYWDDASWGEDVPQQKDVLDEENFTGGDVITFADIPVDFTNPEKIQEYKELGFNTSLLTEDHIGSLGEGADAYYSASMSTANAPENGLNFEYRYGTASLIQVNTNLPASTPIVNFTVDQNGCSIDQSGNTVQWVGWIGMANAEDTIVLTFNFNSEFQVGQSYVLPKGAVFGFTDGNTYSLDADYTFTWDGANWNLDASALSFTLTAADAKYIQLKTNIPTGLTYGDFLLGDTAKGNLILETTEGAQSVAWFSYSELSGAVYLTFNFNAGNKNGAQYILKAGTTLIAGDKTYTTDRDYILTVNNSYLSGIENLDNAGLNVWIRNFTNKLGYFDQNMTNILLLYKDVIDGFYMVDEAFQSSALLEAAGQQDKTTDIRSLAAEVVTWFNTNFAGKYFHSNQVPVSSYDHYTGTNGETLSALDAAGYKKFLEEYKALFNAKLDASGSSVGFDNYPFTHKQGFNISSFKNLPGIEETYLLNCLLAAQAAGNYDFSLCIQTFEASDLKNKTQRDIQSAAEVSFQIYTGLAMGADVFEYFAYNSNNDFNAIMNQDGSKRIYDIVKEGNNALCFADVVNSFTWNGIVTSIGSKNSDNSAAFNRVADMVLTNISNGVLSSYASTDDAIIGCFTKGDLNGYMVVNYNDPQEVTGNNTVSVSFENCTRARVYTQVDGVLTSEIVELSNGSYEAVLAPGAACFIIPA